jgi:hypothetical protein
MLYMCIALIANSLHAQNGGGKMLSPKVWAEKEVETMKTTLGLTADQVKKVTPITVQYAEKRHEISEEARNSHDFPTMHQKILALNEVKDAAMKPILSDAQYVEYQKLMKKTRVQFRQR